jgi:hypothetical protein
MKKQAETNIRSVIVDTRPIFLFPCDDDINPYNNILIIFGTAN